MSRYQVKYKEAGINSKWTDKIFSSREQACLFYKEMSKLCYVANPIDLVKDEFVCGHNSKVFVGDIVFVEIPWRDYYIGELIFVDSNTLEVFTGEDTKSFFCYEIQQIKKATKKQRKNRSLYLKRQIDRLQKHMEKLNND